MRSRLGRLLTSALTILAVAAVICRCEHSASSADGDSDAASEASVPPEAGLPDAGLDGQVLPDATQHDFCGEALFKLPIDGQTEATYGLDIWDEHVIWAKENTSSGTPQSDIYLLNLSTCVESVLTNGAEAFGPSIHNEDIYWYDISDSPNDYCSELYHYSLGTGEASRLTTTAGCEQLTASVGRYLAYSYQATVTEPPSLRLWDLMSGSDIEVSPSWTNIQADYFKASDNNLVWVAYTQDPLSIGRDVFYRDLWAGETHHIDASYDDHQYFPFIWQEWITWQDMAGYVQYPSAITLYNLVTQERIQIVSDDHAAIVAPIRDGLVAYNTSRYSGTNLQDPSDLEVYEVETGLTRRITAFAGNFRVLSIDPPFMLLTVVLHLPDNRKNDYYIANLEALGVIDSQGSLIPGGPVITPP